MQFLKVGHSTCHERGTGVSVFLFEQPAPAAYYVCGAAPASHELQVLDLEAAIPYIDGIVLTGGSAFGLPAVAGVMQWFAERQRGYQTSYGVVPILPAASIFDLGVKSSAPPTAADAYAACQAAQENNPLQGCIGAGTGASIGKAIPGARSMSGGVGFAEITLPNAVSVLAYAVVNSFGDVRDATGKIIAGACQSAQQFADCERYILSGQPVVSPLANTTLVAIFTNVDLTKAELKRVAKVAAGGIARAISPVFTCYDGDIIFCAALGKLAAAEITVSVLAAEAVRQAIVNAVKGSILLEG